MWGLPIKYWLSEKAHTWTKQNKYFPSILYKKKKRLSTLEFSLLNSEYYTWLLEVQNQPIRLEIKLATMPED